MPNISLETSHRGGGGGAGAINLEKGGGEGFLRCPHLSRTFLPSSGNREVEIEEEEEEEEVVITRQYSC